MTTETAATAPAPAEGAPAAAPETPAATIQAVLAERRTKREQPESKEPAAAPSEAAAPAQPDTSPGDQPGGEAQGGAEGQAAEGAPAEGVEPAKPPAVQPPQYWSKEAKAKFAELPPDLQAIVADQERGGESIRGKAKQEAAEARKAAEKEAGAYRERSARLGELLPQLESNLAGKWDGVTPDVWAEVARADPAKYAVLKADYDADQAKLTTARDEHAKAEGARHDHHVRQLIEELPTAAPELADPKEGPKRLQELFGYLGEQGIGREDLKWVSAGQLAIARKAMLYDRGQAAIAAAATRKDPNPAPPPLKPSSGQPAGAHTQQRLASLDAKAARTGQLADVLEARRARRAAKG